MEWLPLIVFMYTVGKDIHECYVKRNKKQARRSSRKDKRRTR